MSLGGSFPERVAPLDVPAMGTELVAMDDLRTGRGDG